LEKKFNESKKYFGKMKKVIFLFLVLIFANCSSEPSNELSNESTNEEIIIVSGLGKTSSEYVANWNKLVSDISSDEDTVLYFSINPDKVRWTSTEQNTLFYQFGDIENTNSSFVINIAIRDEIVDSVEFFSPASTDDVTSQRTKLFFLILVAMADETLDKDGRESVLSKVGLYDEVISPEQIGGSVTLNNIQYVVEPLIDKGFLIGINFYTTRVLDNS
jgi:hypothetical protein